MDVSTLIALILALLSIGSLIGSWVWAVSKMDRTARITTTKLDTTLSHVERTVASLDQTVQLVLEKLNNHETRITVIETLGRINSEQPNFEAKR